MRALFSVFLAAALFVPHVSSAAQTGDWRLGALAGQVGLLGDVGNDDENGVGLGLLGGYYVREDLVFEGSILSSSHESVRHRDLSIGGNWYLGDYVAAYPNLVAGVSFISNRIKDIGVTSDGFGIYVGGGFDFEITPTFTAGIQVRYLKAFEGKSTVEGVERATIDDSLMVLLRLMYTFGSAE